MARVCISCGLTTDVQGRLIVNTGGAAWPYACPDTNGIPIVCGTDGVIRLSEPARTHLRTVVETVSPVSGEITDAAFGSPVIGGGLTNFGVPLTVTINNPSTCLPMSVLVRHGVQHGVWRKDDAGDSQALYGTTLTNTLDGSTNDAHESYRNKGGAAGDSVIIDTMNNTHTFTHSIPAGASVTYTATPHIQVQHYNGNTSITSFIAVLDVDAWHA